MTVTVEQLTPNELNQFWQVFVVVIKEGFPGYSQAVINYFINQVYTLKAYYYWLTTGWKTIFVAKLDNAIIGFAVIDRPYGGVCFLRWLGVLSNFRHKGIGKLLVQRWLDYAKNYDCHKAEVAAQPEAKKFYQKCQLDYEGERKLSYFGIDQFIFGKVINKANDEIMTKD